MVCVGTYLFSRAAARQVSSAQVSLTSVFGMGTGGPSPQSAPTMYRLSATNEIIAQAGSIVNTFLQKNLKNYFSFIDIGVIKKYNLF